MLQALGNRWRAWHSRPAWLRAPLKLGAWLLLVALTLYPKVWLIPTWLAREQNLDAVIEPNNPHLAPLEAEVRQALPPDAPTSQALDAVETVVYRHVPYAWDWDVWGVVDYLPTVDEVFEQGREDCDGRAIVAASLLRRMGYQAWVVSDVLHMWVQTPQGETMGPTGGDKTLVGGPGGTKAHLSLGLIDNLVRGNAYGIAVFPLWRELLIILSAALLRLQPRIVFWRSFSGVLMLLLALGITRAVGEVASSKHHVTEAVEFLGALLLFVVGIVIVGLRAGVAPRHSAPMPPG